MNIDKISVPVPLRSESDDLVLTFIGTGSAFTKKNYQNNLIVVKNDTHLIIDIGTKATQGLFEKGIKVADIKAYLVTHVHADHIGSFEEVALIGRYFTKQKPDLIIPPVLKDIFWENSLKGGIAYNEKPLLTLDDVFSVVTPRKLRKYPRPTYGINYKGIDVKIFKTNHIPGEAKTLEEAAWASGVIIDERVLFTADTKFDRAMLDDFDKMFDIELILHDCQFFTGGVHASYDELKALPDKYKKKMLLTHYADNWEQFKPENDGFMGFTQRDLRYSFAKK